MKNINLSSAPSALSAAWIVAAFLVAPIVAQAAATDISKTPLTSNQGVKPNVMLLMDTSNSMKWTHMPDSVEVQGAKQKIGYKSYLCNSIYYNPTRVYKTPKKEDGSNLPVPAFATAPYDYYLAPGITVNLGSDFQAHDVNTVSYTLTSLPDTPQAAYYFQFTPAGSITKPTVNACSQAEPAVAAGTAFSATDGGQWTKILVSSSSDRQNFAIWYTYYRTRILMAKGAIATALSSPVINDARVGLVTVMPGVNNTSVTSSNPVASENYLKIDDFSGTHKTNFYTKLNGLKTGNSSPAREALARVGRHYAGQTNGINNGMPDDPMLASCQSNYTILTTDGYWNAQEETVGPVKIDGTTKVKQQDGSPVYTAATNDAGDAPKGVYDGLPTGTVEVNTSTVYQSAYCTYPSDGKYTRTVKKAVDVQTKVVTTYAANNGFIETKITKATTQTTRTVVDKKTVSYTLTGSWGEWKKLDETIVIVKNCSLAGAGTCTSFNPAAVAQASCPAASWPAGWPAQPLITSSCSQSSSTTTVNPSNCTASSTVTCGTPVVTFVNTNSTSCNTNASQLCTSTTITSGTATSCTAAYDSNTGITTSCGTSSSAVSSCAASAGVTCTPTCIGTCTPTVVTTTGVACTASSSSSGTVTCPYAVVSSATAVDPSTCPATLPSTDPASSSNGWKRTTCTETLTSTVSAGGACAGIPASSMNSWVQTICVPGGYNASGQKLQSRVKTDTVTTPPPGGGAATTYSSYGSWSDVTPPSPPANCVPTGTLVIPPTTSPVVVSTTSVGANSSLNSLADVAQYYYLTDLRTGSQPFASPDNVKPRGAGWNDDKNEKQHMTTFVIGLGVSGTKTYDPNYKTATTGDFGAIRAGTAYWPEWPIDPPSYYSGNISLYNDPRSIDDFWHAAVNGRGQYFSADDPNTLAAGLNDAFAGILGGPGAGTGAVLSDSVYATDLGLTFATGFDAGDWSGNLFATDNTGVLKWDTRDKLDGQVGANCDDRKIYIRNTGSSNGLGEFTWATTKCGSSVQVTSLTLAQQAMFDVNMLSHYVDMSVAQVAAATGSTLVNYLRGQTQHAGFVAGLAGKLYRKRAHALGDIIGSRPEYVAAPTFNYADSGYAAFKTSKAGRKSMVYVGANDGMLHAIYAPQATLNDPSEGKEAWAYIPTLLLPKMYKLANANYVSNHELFVDGTPVVGDVQSSGTWRTILVGGLGGGGGAYYALDITDPDAPKSLWEFDTSTTGSDLGMTMGKPVIIKLASGQWVVMVTSGYNNSSGLGKLHILDAVTGALIRTMSTPVGSATNPSGLTHVTAWVDDRDSNFTAKRVYGGDLLGNIWRFDINDNIAPIGTYDVTLLGTAKDAYGNIQPITAAPELGLYNKKPYVYVGTGRLLGASDMTTNQIQSIYGIYDPLTTMVSTSTPVYSDLRSTSSKVLKTVVTPIYNNLVMPPVKIDETISVTCASASCSGTYPNGWAIDLSVSGERVNIRPALLRNTLVVASNTPLSAAGSCLSNFESRIYFINPVKGDETGAGEFFSKATMGLTFIYPDPATYGTLGTDDSRIKVRARFADRTSADFGVPSTTATGKVMKRASFRGIVRPASN